MRRLAQLPGDNIVIAAIGYILRWRAHEDIGTGLPTTTQSRIFTLRLRRIALAIACIAGGLSRTGNHRTVTFETRLPARAARTRVLALFAKTAPGTR